MIKTTFPHMGTFHIPMKSLLLNLGLEPLAPPPTSQNTIAIGAELSPEFACLPFKVNLGNYIEAIGNGAELIFMAGGVGPCRFGYYSQVQREALAGAGYGVELVTFEAPNADPGELYRKVKKYIPRSRIEDLIQGLYIFWKKARAIDSLDRLANKVRGREEKPGTTTKIQNRFYKALDDAATLKEINQVIEWSLNDLKSIRLISEAKPIKIMLLGEIYMVLERRVNFRIEEQLGHMGVEVKRSIYLSDWIEEHFSPALINKTCSRLQKLAKPYLESHIGGHGLESVAYGVEAGVNRMDGIIQLAPFTCMPEIVAMAPLTSISRDFSIPLLHLIIDEHSGEAGIRTRLEAFIDLLKHRKTKNNNETIEYIKNEQSIGAVH